MNTNVSKERITKMSNFVAFTLFTVGIAAVYFVLDKLMLMLTKKRKSKRGNGGGDTELHGTAPHEGGGRRSRRSGG